MNYYYLTILYFVFVILLLIYLFYNNKKENYYKNLTCTQSCLLNNGLELDCNNTCATGICSIASNNFQCIPVEQNNCKGKFYAYDKYGDYNSAMNACVNEL